MNRGEKYIPEIKTKVDGYCLETNTIFQFHGCFRHGCQRCYKHNKVKNKTMYCLNVKTQLMNQQIINAGYK